MFVVTGANGFIGKALVAELAKRGHYIRATSRSIEQISARENIEHIQAPSLEAAGNWSKIFLGSSTVIHTAGRARLMQGSREQQAKAFHDINTKGTLNLAQQAAEAGVRRFVFLSSIKVNGEETELGKPFKASDRPNPESAYGKSKLEAEFGLRRLAEQSGMEVVILRLPIVYGPGVKGNFEALINILRLGLPLPLASIENQRSMVGLSNLMDVTILASTHKDAKNMTMLVSDDNDISTTALIKMLGQAIGSKPHLFSLPPIFLLKATHILGRPDIARRLFSSLQLDISETKNVLSWRPPSTVEKGLEDAFRSYRR